MEHENRHIIHKQSLELEVEGSISDRQIREKYQQKLSDDILAIMEPMFDGICHGHEKLIIDKLSIDMGEVSEDEFASRFRKILSDSLADISRDIREKTNPASSGNKLLDKDSLLTGVFLFFLKFGHLPWWRGINDLKALEKVPQVGNKNFAAALAGSLKEQNARRRLTQQFSLDFNVKLIGLLFAGYEDKTRSLVAKLAAIISTMQKDQRADPSFIENHILENIWMILLAPGEKPKEKYHFQERLTASLIDEFDLSFEEMAGKFSQLDLALLQGLVEYQKENAKQKIQEPFQENQTEFTIENSGLVIFWPYLRNLYDNLGLINENNVFISEAEQERAVLILEYLVCGSTDIPEHSLPLNKLMNSWPLSKPVRRKLMLNDKERKILEEFPGFIIQQWPMLKDSSTKALRESFLQRKGNIRKIDNGWRLQVERQGLDILRDNLPWPLGIIKLSWMDTTLYVKW